MFTSTSISHDYPTDNIIASTRNSPTLAQAVLLPNREASATRLCKASSSVTDRYIICSCPHPHANRPKSLRKAVTRTCGPSLRGLGLHDLWHVGSHTVYHLGQPHHPAWRTLRVVTLVFTSLSLRLSVTLRTTPHHERYPSSRHLKPLSTLGRT